jgi:hypothetical protein
MSFDLPYVGARGENFEQRFQRFIEQLQHAVSMLRSGRIALQCMALVAIDNLAEGLLFRHLEHVFLVSDEPTWVEHREFPARERRAAREQFNKRVELAAEKLQTVMPVYFPEPILDPHDALVFRVAHHYRNPIYHQDRHNPTLIDPVGRLYAQAVGRAFVRSHPDGWAVFSPPGFMQEIARFGSQSGELGAFWPRQAAKQIMASICDPLTVDGAVLRREMADDISFRCDVIDDALTTLRRDAFIDLDEFLALIQDWAANRGDEEMLRLQAEHRMLGKRLNATATSDPKVVAAMRDIEHQQWTHVFGSGRKLETRINLKSHLAIRQKGERLRGARSSEAWILERYRQLDDDLQFFEAAIHMMMRETDRHTWAEQDRARGS